jgi:LPXTG-site transpeptidase (sortase) family protein
MTLVEQPPASDASDASDAEAAERHQTTPGPDEWYRSPPDPVALPRRIAGSMLLTLALCAIGFVVWLAFGSKLYYDRVQHDSYASFRGPLAGATAPTGPTDPFDATRLLALGTPVALLDIPAIKLNAVVLEGTTGQVLEGGPGHLRYTQLPGQQGVSVIFGRRAAYGGPFEGLSSLGPGDLIVTTTGQGVAHYKVLDVRRAGDPLPAPLEAGQSRLTLVTADGAPFAPSGELYVDADLIGNPFPAPAMMLSAANLSPAENALGIDSLAWMPLVLWGQLLLLAAAAIGWLARSWGRWQTWIIAVPVLGYLGLQVADEVTRLLPNLM